MAFDAFHILLRMRDQQLYCDATYFLRFKAGYKSPKGRKRIGKHLSFLVLLIVSQSPSSICPVAILTINYRTEVAMEDKEP